MVVKDKPRPPAPPDDKSNHLQGYLDQMTRDIEGGALVRAAAENAMDAISREKLKEILWDEIGATALIRQWNWRMRTKRQRIEHSQPPTKRVANAQAVTEGLFDQFYNVNGQPKMLGSMNKADCDWMAADYTRLTETNARQSRYFTLVAKGFKNETQTIVERYSEDEIYDFIKQAKS